MLCFTTSQGLTFLCLFATLLLRIIVHPVLRYEELNQGDCDEDDPEDDAHRGSVSEAVSVIHGRELVDVPHGHDVPFLHGVPRHDLEPRKVLERPRDTS